MDTGALVIIYSLMQGGFLQRGGIVAVLLTEFQPGDTAPNDLALAPDIPGAPSIRRSALPADQPFRQRVFSGVFALLGFRCFLLNLALAGSALHLGLYPLDYGL